MLRNYLKSAIRNLFKHKFYTITNIFGLGVGLAACLIVIGHVGYELTFEDFHVHKDRIYRVNSFYAAEESEIRSARVMAPLGPALEAEIPEVENAAVFRQYRNGSLEIEEKTYRVGDILCAAPDFYDVFTFSLRQGDPETALASPLSVLVSEKAVEEYFNGINPVGKTITLNNKFECQVTGILEDMPDNTQLQTDFIISYASLEAVGEDLSNWEGEFTDFAFLLLYPDAERLAVEQKIPAILAGRIGAEAAAKYSFELQPLKDIYFDVYGARRSGDFYPAGEASMIYSMGLVAGFMLLLAIANFVNLSTAKSADRVKEVGVRKVFGALRTHLIRQFLGESILITTMAVIVGLAVYEIIKPSFNMWFQRDALAGFFSNPMMFVTLIATVVLTAIAAGFYPAFYLSGFTPIAILQNKTRAKSTKSLLRKGLVVFQFAIAITFIVCTTIMFKQINFISSVDLGFEREDMLVLDFEGEDGYANCRLMKNEILSRARVASTTASNSLPGVSRGKWGGLWVVHNDEAREEMIFVKGYHVDYDFLSTFGLQIVEGRGFSREIDGDGGRKVVISESMVKNLQIERPTGYQLYDGEDEFMTVVGVVKDFHGSPFKWGYRDMAVLELNSEACRTLTVKLPSHTIAASIAEIETIWKDIMPGDVFNYTFLDDEIAKNYTEDRGVAVGGLVFSVITICIACLGILGLVSYTAQQRTKEIGIRKVLGASAMGIIRLLSREFVILIVIANAVAWPIAYWSMLGYLQESPVRVSIGIGTFVFTGLVALLLALLMTGFHAAKAALANPVDSLRHE